MNPYLQDISKLLSTTTPYFTFTLLSSSILASKIFINSPCKKNFAPGVGLNALILPYTSFDELLSSCEVDAISNTTPDSFHKEIAIKSLRNNKHIFSEKPLATNYPDALEMYEETTKKKLINMVNFSYRNSSGYQELAKIVQSGELGSVRHIEAAYYLSWLTSKNQGDWKVDDHLKWRLSTKHGSLGVLGETGVHIIDFATYPVGRLKRIKIFLLRFDGLYNFEELKFSTLK